MGEVSGREAPSPLLQYSIVKGILEKLPFVDLLATSKVCKLWNEIGRVVRKQRKNRAETALWHPYGQHTDEVFEYYNGQSVSPAVTTFIETTAPSIGFPSVAALVQEQSWSPLLPQLRSWVMDDFLDAYSESQFCVVVSTAAVDEYMPSDEDNGAKLKIVLNDIPKAIPCFLTFSYGIIGSLKDEAKSLEMENSEMPMISLLRIPKVPGLKIKMFTVTKETNAKYRGKVDDRNCETILNISPNDNVKGIVLFHTDVRKAGSLKDAIFQYIKKNPHVALGGGSHYRNLASICEGDNTPIGAGLIICGNDNDVIVASVALVDSKISRRNEQKLIDMKSCEIPGGDSFALMFACNGRGANMHGATNVECNLFRRHFPRTSLIGTFTGGEYCHEVIPTKHVPTAPKRPSNIEFAYTTVFVFASYKHPTRLATAEHRS